MKKTYKFYSDGEAYKLKLDSEDKFTISKETLEFNGIQFYEGVFKEYSEDDEIIMENVMTEEEMKQDKIAKGVFDTIKDIVEDIKLKLSEQK